MWFFNNKIRHLPAAKGPYVPSCIDFMLEYAASGIFARLYYPTKLKHDEVDSTHWINWLANDNYIIGIAKAIMVFPIITKFLAWWTSAYSVRTPALYGEKVNTDHKLKCVLFSHGYAANRFFSSITCNELASRGYLVAVIEHRDQSAAFTYYYKNKEDVIADNKTPIYVKRILFGERHYDQRNAQVHQRAKECIKLLDTLIELNNGKIPDNILDNAQNLDKYNFNWEDLIGQLDLSTLTMAGHSFGGATALKVLSQRKDLKQGVLLDPWMFSLKHEENLNQNVTQPLIFINSQTFHILPNINAMEKYLTNDERTMFTILHSTHEVQTDSASVFGYWLNWFMKKLSPANAADINNALILRFLKTYTGNREDLVDCELLLAKEGENFVEGLTKPWAR